MSADMLGETEREGYREMTHEFKVGQWVVTESNDIKKIARIYKSVTESSDISMTDYSWFSFRKLSPLTLRHGDYVMTKGMAGDVMVKLRGAEPNHSSGYDALVLDGKWLTTMTTESYFTGERLLTIEQILSTLPEEEDAPKVGDKVMLSGSSTTVPDGEYVMTDHVVYKSPEEEDFTDKAEQTKFGSLSCPECRKPHIDVGEWAKKPHHKHLCHYCHHVWAIHPYTFGDDRYRDMGTLKQYALGFDSGFRYSAADKIAALREENTTLRKALEHSNIWVKSALACKSWVWSGDQREAAESSVNEAKAVLKETGK